MQRRRLGRTDLQVSVISLGCWPLAGMTSAGVTEEESVATIAACFELGINFLDTAYIYGAEGESERRIAKAIAGRRDEVVIATKGGIHWNDDGQQNRNATPSRLNFECESSLQRLGVEYVDLYYLHAPDPSVPIEDSAGAIKELLDAGKIRSAGVSNVTLDEMKRFATVCPLTAYQPPYNLLHRSIEAEAAPWCVENSVSIMPYWPLMKGLLTGKFKQGHVFPAGDGRVKYPAFQGEEFERNLLFVDRLRAVADEAGHTVAQTAINWLIHRPGITSALCGAVRPDQIRDNAGAADWQLSPEQLHEIENALTQRGEPAVSRAVR